MIREWLARMGLALAACLVALGLVELGLRLPALEPAAVRPPRRLNDAERRLVLDCYAQDPRGELPLDLGDPETLAHYAERGVRRLEAALERAPHCVEARYNRHGYRGGPIPEKPPGAFRVAVLGDSFTEGQGVREEAAFPALLEAGLRRRDPRWQVVNCGRRASDFPELHEQFYRLLAVADPELVLYALVLNDAAASASLRERHADVYDWIMVGGGGVHRRFRELEPWDSRLAFFVRERIEARRLVEASTRWYLDLYGEPNREGWQRTRAALGDMRDRMRVRGGRLAVAIWPLLVDLDAAYPFESIHHTLRRALEEEGIPYLDLLEALRGEPAEALHVADVDHHPNERAHGLAAEALVPFVASVAPEAARLSPAADSR